MDDAARVRQGVGAARRGAVRSGEWASPADLHCRDERLFSVEAAASNNCLLLHLSPTFPPRSLHFSPLPPSPPLSLLTLPQYYIVPLLQVYPVAMVTQC